MPHGPCSLGGGQAKELSCVLDKGFLHDLSNAPVAQTKRKLYRKFSPILYQHIQRKRVSVLKKDNSMICV